MGLHFQNQYRNTVSIAFVYGDTACGSKFRKQGWWNVGPGQTFTIWNVDLRTVNRFACFYAEEFKGGGGATWSGTGNKWFSIRDVAFNQCYEDNTGCNQQPNFVDIDFDSADNGPGPFPHPFVDMVITLGPSPGQIRRTGSQPIDDG
jgi:uncharacterized membrane protein